MHNVTVSTKSEQTVVTPRDFLGQLCKIWPCSFDLAATQENKRFAGCYTPEDDALSIDWLKAPVKPGEYGFLNSPFSNRKICKPDCDKKVCKERGWHQEHDVKGLPTWMEKCAKEGQRGFRTASLTLSSRGSDWYHEFVKPYALSLILRGRLQFEGHPTVYTKELMVNIFGLGITGEGYWDWKENL